MVDLLSEGTHRELRPRRIKTRGNLAGAEKRELYGEDIRPPPKTFCNKIIANLMTAHSPTYAFDASYCLNMQPASSPTPPGLIRASG